jgi:hypothetical protein
MMPHFYVSDDAAPASHALGHVMLTNAGHHADCRGSAARVLLMFPS